MKTRGRPPGAKNKDQFVEVSLKELNAKVKEGVMIPVKRDFVNAVLGERENVVPSGLSP